MRTWAGLVLALFQLLLALVQFLKRRQLLDEVTAKFFVETLSDADQRLARIHAASDAARSEPVPDDSSIFRD